MRDNLISLGITRMSAGSQTGVGQYAEKKRQPKQFNINDTRTVAEIAKTICKKGYEPVFKDLGNAEMRVQSVMGL